LTAGEPIYAYTVKRAKAPTYMPYTTSSAVSALLAGNTVRKKEGRRDGRGAQRGFIVMIL
jgi:hypothetical protein